MVFYYGVIKCNFYFIDSVVSASPSPRYIPMPPCPIFHAQRGFSIKTHSTSGLDLWKLLSQVILWLLTCLIPPSSPSRALYPFWCYGVPLIFVPGSCTMCPSSGVCYSWKMQLHAWAIISLGTYWVYQNLVQVAMPDGNVRILEITFSHRPLQHPAVTLWACSKEAFSMEIYHHRHWNILQISHEDFGDDLGFPVSSGISNHKVISCVRRSMSQVILLTESKNDPHNI